MRCWPRRSAIRNPSPSTRKLSRFATFSPIPSAGLAIRDPRRNARPRSKASVHLPAVSGNLDNAGRPWHAAYGHVDDFGGRNAATRGHKSNWQRVLLRQAPTKFYLVINLRTAKTLLPAQKQRATPSVPGRQQMTFDGGGLAFLRCSSRPLVRGYYFVDAVSTLDYSVDNPFHAS